MLLLFILVMLLMYVALCSTKTWTFKMLCTYVFGGFIYFQHAVISFCRYTSAYFHENVLEQLSCRELWSVVQLGILMVVAISLCCWQLVDNQNVSTSRMIWINILPRMLFGVLFPRSLCVSSFPVWIRMSQPKILLSQRCCAVYLYAKPV